MTKSPNLYKDVKKFIEELEKAGGKPLYEMEPKEARDFLVNLQRKSHKPIDAVVEDTNIFTEMVDNVDVRIARPTGVSEKLPVIIYAHGGGWVMGDKEVFDELIRKLAACTKSAVFFVNYDRSPEAVYPKAVDQIYGVMDYVYNNPDDFYVDSSRMVIAGDSAGGNMATVAALRAKRENGPKLLYQVLLYPVTDAGMDTKSYEEFENGPWLTKKAMEWFWDAYMPDKDRRDDWYISPLKTPVEELKGMPPTLIITDENDVLRDEGEAYAAKLDEAGVNVISVRIDGIFHDFMMLNAVSDTEPAKAAFILVCKILKKVLHK